MEFEFDPKKSESNERKHGIDFVESQELWLDPDRIEIPAKTSDESRWMVIGRIGERVWSAVIAYRGEKVRLICVRRSRKEEMELYESEDI
ncbi:MAG: BrnT family toxin [Nitrospirae bacterium]|nr:BrnT family toxin [Nitrospirota bacterium]